MKSCHDYPHVTDGYLPDDEALGSQFVHTIVPIANAMAEDWSSLLENISDREGAEGQIVRQIIQFKHESACQSAHQLRGNFAP